MNEERFLTEYENLLDKGYCNCNEMNCIDNNSPRRILNIAKRLQQEKQKYKAVIDKADKWVRNYMDEWDIYDEVWHDLNDLLILLEEVE